jgi:hypothetical protein
MTDEQVTSKLQTLCEFMYFVLAFALYHFMFYAETQDEYFTCYCIVLYKMFYLPKADEMRNQNVQTCITEHE